MKDLKDISKVYFLGIGGIGMSALARYFNEQGLSVKGYDKTSSPLTDKLMQEGMDIHFDDDLTLLDKEADLVIYTPAIPQSHNQLNWYKENGYELYKRSAVLGMISSNHYCIAVAGSHGKTTVSSMLAHILNGAGGCIAFLGGIASNYNSNYIHTSNRFMVVEADEFDRSFLTLHPNIAGITAIDSDHLEVYGSLENIEEEFIQFAKQIVPQGQLILNEHYSHILSRVPKHLEVSQYGHEKQADYSLTNYSVKNGEFVFTVTTPNGVIENLTASFGGIHNLENATLAISICEKLGISNRDIRKGIRSFKGIKRRFEKHVDIDGTIYIDDYAHHPMEIKALVKSLRFLYPEKEILAIFQPHLFSRTKNLYEEFAHELAQVDDLILLPIYPAREEPIEGVSSELILNKVALKNKAIIDKTSLIDSLRNKVKNKVVVTIGAGDIDRFVEPIKEMLQ